MPPLETYVVVSLAFAVFAAVTSVGAALVLGIGYERIRSGLERVKEGLDIIRRQTGFFTTQMYNIESRVDALSNKMEQSQDPMVLGKSKKTKTRSKKLSDEKPREMEHGESLTVSASSFSVPEAANDLQKWHFSTREEALENFANARSPEGKIRFM